MTSRREPPLSVLSIPSSWEYLHVLFPICVLLLLPEDLCHLARLPALLVLIGLFYSHLKNLIPDNAVARCNKERTRCPHMGRKLYPITLPSLQGPRSPLWGYASAVAFDKSVLKTAYIETEYAGNTITKREKLPGVERGTVRWVPYCRYSGPTLPS